jgi:CPA2 family monovalent cation:H+ antiporter-2
LRSEKAPKERSVLRSNLVVLALDALILIVILILSAIFEEPIGNVIQRFVPVGEDAADGIQIALTFLVSLPFLIWTVRSARILGASLAANALPTRAALDMADAPRKTLMLILELLTVLMVGVILLAATQPFLPSISGPAFLLVMLAIFAFMVWRGAADLQAHYKAGAQVIAEALSKASQSDESIHDVEQMLPGLGDISSVAVKESSPVIGKTLADLDIHGQTGALVVAIRRDAEGVIVPGGKVELRSGDVLALVGTEEAIESAKRIFTDS